MTLRNKLLGLILILGLISIVFVAIGTKDAFENRRVIDRSLVINAISDQYLAAATFWAVERGTANAVIADPAKATPAQRQTIKKNREAGDAALAEAGRLFANSGIEDAALRRSHARAEAALKALAALRPAVDSSAVAEPQLIATWFPTANALIMATLDAQIRLRDALGESAPPIVDRLFEIRWLLAIFGEYAGRERGGMAGAIAAGKPLSVAQALTQGANQGQIQQAHTGLQALAPLVSPDFARVVDEAARGYFEEFGQVRSKVMAAANAGDAYPIDAPTWFAQATRAIEKVLAAQAAASREASASLAEAQNRSDWQIGKGAVLAAGVLMIVLFSVWMVSARVSAPLSGMTQAMTLLAEGKIQTDIPSIGRSDEIGNMADAVQVFKQNAMRLAEARLAQEEQEKRMTADRRKIMEDLADGFERSVGSVVEGVTAAAAEMQAQA
jgi:HAMP domain-containing protein